MRSFSSAPLLCFPLLVSFFLLFSACGPLVSPDLVAVTPLPQRDISGRTSATTPPEATAPEPITPASAIPTDALAAESTRTPTPLSLLLPPGSAAAIALATDSAMQPTVANPIEFANSPVAITFDEFYNGFNMRTGVILSDKLLALDGKEVVIEGYMAPPLKPELDWFVLTRIRLEFCPFCSSTADWPDDIALVYLLDDPIVTTIQPLRVQGRMEIGSAVDPETGMVSLVRIYAKQIDALAAIEQPALAHRWRQP